MSHQWILRASEIDTFLTCPRKWGFAYLDKIEAPPTPAMEFGTRVHKLLEQHLKGYPIKYDTAEGRVASAGLKFLPKNTPHGHIEKKIFFEHSGHIFLGTPDFFEHLGSQTWLLGDHKTCSTFASAISGEQLKKNVQANIYAQWLIQEKKAEIIKLKWIYYRKTKPEAHCVEAELTKKEADGNFAGILKTADTIARLAKSPSPTLLKNKDACFKYGRCPFYAHCHNSQRTATHTKTHEEIPLSTDIKKERFVNDPLLPKPNSFHLYVDCVPTKSEVGYDRTIELADLLKPVYSKIQTEEELSHYRLASYGKHIVLIANYLSEHLRVNAYDNRTAILSSSKTPEGCDTLETLTVAAGHVVRGF